MSLIKRWKKLFDDKERKEETEFLPAILEVTETPPSPVGRLVLWTILALLTCGLLWSVLGHIDEMAVAEGKVIPYGQVKAVQVKNKGIIKEILVHEGDIVAEGDPLVLLDPTSTGADYDSLNKRAAYYKLDIARLEAELTDQEFTASTEDGVLDARDVAAELMLYQSRRGNYLAELAAAQSAVNQKQAALAISKENYEKYSGMHEIAVEKENRLAELFQENAISEFQLLEQRSQRLELKKNMLAENNHMSQTAAELEEAQKRLNGVSENYRKDIMNSLVDARKQYYALEEAIKKADEDSRLSTIKAPCDGRIYNLAVHTVGGIVTDAQTLMMVVPKEADLVIEVWADNKDIGFIKTEQEAEVKVATFNFQKFGVVKAEVADIAPDAASDERDPATYERYRLLLKPKESAADNNITLAPGMHVTAEVKIKQKRIIDFFLEPFRRYTSESLRER